MTSAQTFQSCWIEPAAESGTSGNRILHPSETRLHFADESFLVGPEEVSLSILAVDQVSDAGDGHLRHHNLASVCADFLYGTI
ncbi:MAG TPA: hypothetical protein VM182_00635 [Terriglobia bacterium]|nr:hypothetical protein [Terriglobia bacterium]